jgi:hypothetical protein
MAKTSIPSNVRSKKFAWMRAHKAWATFFCLIVLLALYLAGSWVVIQIQIRDERARFNDAKILLRHVAQDSFSGNLANVRSYSECSYTDNGAVFATRWLGCGTGFKVFLSSISETNAVQALNSLKTSIRARSFTLRSNGQSMGTYDIGVYDFDANHLSCAITAAYYTDDAPTYKRYSGASDTGNGALFEVDCSGPAKSPYFPVTSD